MRRFLIAVAVAIGASISVPVVEAPAASITINENGVTVRDGRHGGYRNHRRAYRERRHYHGRRYERLGAYRHRGYRDHCRVRTVKTYRHHRVIIRKVRVCR